jgi:hypothetical protein
VKTHRNTIIFVHFLQSHAFICEIIITTKCYGYAFEVEVPPCDTIWTLKWNIHREDLRKASERALERPLAPPRDDQILTLISL